jgi:hypothetical protein
MANAVVASWTACVRELQQMLDTADAAEADVSKLFQRADKLGDQLSLPHAAWKKLVHDVQVTHAGTDVTLSLCLGRKHRCQASRGVEHIREGLWKQVPPEISDVQPAHGHGKCTGRLSLAHTVALLPGWHTLGCKCALSPLCCCCCMQITAKLAALYVQVLRQPDPPEYALLLTYAVLTAWLVRAVAAIEASPGSRATAAVVQQLQDSQLLQHLGPAMDEGLESRGVSDTLQLYPAASELLLLPESVSCLAIVLVSVLLGLDTSSDDWLKAADTTATSSSSTPGVGSSTGRQAPGTGVPQPQQQQQQRPGNSGGSSSSSSSSSSSGMAAGVRLGSLTPLSCGLFPLLGITKETALQAARLAKAQGLTTLASLDVLVAAYRDVIVHQVSRRAAGRTVNMSTVWSFGCAHTCACQLEVLFVGASCLGSVRLHSCLPSIIVRQTTVPLAV